MSSLHQVFMEAKSRVVKVIVAIDLTNSTSMKEQEPEASWLTTYGWFFDLLRTSVGPEGTIIKYLGDGAMTVFSENNAAEAINWAIKVQEEFAQARASNRISSTCYCSAGIAYGEVVEFDMVDTAEDRKDYIGSIVDRAFRLCSAANAKAIFVDTDTCAAAALNRVVSKLGTSTTPKRKVAEYQGPEESVMLKGFSRPISYHEILWDTARYGVSPPFVTRLSEQQVKQQRPIQPQQTPSTANWMRGSVYSKGETYGFIRSIDGEDFWFNPDCMFRRVPINRNDVVWFIPADPLGSSARRRATDVLVLGTEISGTLQKVMPKGFGFATCVDEKGLAKELFVFLGTGQAWSPGAEIRFTVGENKQGLAGINPSAK